LEKKKTSYQNPILKMAKSAFLAEKEVFGEEWANMRDSSGTY
jgi:hypothetical protein